ncbi:MAG: nucleotidyltransferase domain-containing protein [Thermoplasmata archaeon]|jgi:predicted nucleotidyltransferase|nr:nucleotidyltransferase domain-containing protein [Thermoplasmata archaeon]
MRFHRSLDQLLTGPTQLRVLRALCKNSARRLTGREMAREARVSTAQTARVLKHLQDSGLATSEAAGRAFTWRWNPDHVWATPIQRLFEEEARIPSGLLRELTEMLHGLPVQKATLFGSIPRRQERDDSDIDLFIETRTAESAEIVREELAHRRAALWRRYGNPLSPMVMTTSEVRQRAGTELLRTVEREGILIPL